MEDRLHGSRTRALIARRGGVWPGGPGSDQCWWVIPNAVLSSQVRLAARRPPAALPLVESSRCMPKTTRSSSTTTLGHTADEYGQPDGLVHHPYPSLQLEPDRQAFWASLCVG